MKQESWSTNQENRTHDSRFLIHDSNMPRRRLDVVLVEGKHAADTRGAFILVTAGRVMVNGQKAVSPGQLVADDDVIEVRPGREFVGRGGRKLEAALERFGVDVAGTVCADVGAATGGFTEVLLKRDAAKVYAIDAGRGKLDLKLRQDSRVNVLEKANVLTTPPLAEQIDLVTVDVSLTSLSLVLPRIRSWLSERGSVVALFKPQYEIKNKSLLTHGIVEDAALRQAAITDFRGWLAQHGWRELGFMESPIRGSEGNVEYLFHLMPV